MTDKIHSRRNNVTDDAKRIQETQERMAVLLRTSIAHISAIPEGQIFLNLIMRECGFDQPSIVLNPNTMDINKDTMIINEALRGLYIKLRRMIPEKPGSSSA